MSRVRIYNRVANGRAVPDIAADADLDTGMLTGYIDTDSSGRPGRYRTQVNAGTSLACLLIAGLVADAQQGRPISFGFINPLLYRLSGTPAFRDVRPISKSTPQQNRAAYLPADDTFSPSVDVFDVQDRAQTDQVTAKATTRCPASARRTEPPSSLGCATTSPVTGVDSAGQVLRGESGD
jgi:hypothetical protein